VTHTQPPPPLGQQPVAAPPPEAAVADLSQLDTARLAARLIDGALIFAAVLPFQLAFGRFGWHATVLVLLLSVHYFFVCEATCGQTVGKRLLDLRVVRRDGGPAGVNAIATRSIFRVIEEPVIALIVLVASGRKRRQRVGDLIGGTTVGRADGSAGPPRSPLLFVYPALWLAGAAAFAMLLDPFAPANRHDAAAVAERPAHLSVAGARIEAP
jgi:uncharacterized RDD family membrane protein YckC